MPLPLGTYQWKIRSRNNVGLSAWSTTEEFTIFKFGAEPVSLIAPVEAAAVDNNEPVRFVWKQSPGANRYKLLVEKVPHNFQGADPDLG